MSIYTTQVRWIIEQETIDSAHLPIMQRLTLACPKIFNFDFPIWSEDYRIKLEEKILKRYFNKEIGLETIGLWKFYLNERLNIIMPYYNDLYRTVSVDYDFLTDTNSTEIYTGNKKSEENANYNGKGNMTGSTTESGTSEQTQNSKTLESDLPQANYANLDYGTKLTEGEQSINSSFNNKSDVSQNNDQTSTNNVTNNTNDDYTRTRKGAFGNRSLTQLMMEYRDSLINIDNMILDDLSDLFMNIYYGGF